MGPHTSPQCLNLQRRVALTRISQNDLTRTVKLVTFGITGRYLACLCIDGRLAPVLRFAVCNQSIISPTSLAMKLQLTPSMRDDDLRVGLSTDITIGEVIEDAFDSRSENIDDGSEIILDIMLDVHSDSASSHSEVRATKTWMNVKRRMVKYQVCEVLELGCTKLWARYLCLCSSTQYVPCITHCVGFASTTGTMSLQSFSP